MNISLQRGDIVVCILAGDYGKARPAVIVQSDLFNPTHNSVVVCPISSHLIDAPLFRLSIDSDIQSGLQQPSQILVDKITAIRREKIREKIGTLTPAIQKKLNQAIRLWLNFGE